MKRKKPLAGSSRTDLERSGKTQSSRDKKKGRMANENSHSSSRQSGSDINEKNKK